MSHASGLKLKLPRNTVKLLPFVALSALAVILNSTLATNYFFRIYLFAFEIQAGVLLVYFLTQWAKKNQLSQD